MLRPCIPRIERTTSSMSDMADSGPKHVLWDTPVRLIHWAILIILPISWWTAEEGYMDVHKWLGLSVLVLVLTRLCWGFVGSPQARFRDFVRGPGAVLAYLRGGSAGTPGHNPSGGWSAIFRALRLTLDLSRIGQMSTHRVQPVQSSAATW